MDDIAEKLADIERRLKWVGQTLDEIKDHRQCKNLVTLRDLFPKHKPSTLAFMGLVVATQARKLNIKERWLRRPYGNAYHLYEYDTLIEIIHSFFIESAALTADQ